jgi:hypothetical protein
MSGNSEQHRNTSSNTEGQKYKQHHGVAEIMEQQHGAARNNRAAEAERA